MQGSVTALKAAPSVITMLELFSVCRRYALQRAPIYLFIYLLIHSFLVDVGSRLAGSGVTGAVGGATARDTTI